MLVPTDKYTAQAALHNRHPCARSLLKQTVILNALRVCQAVPNCFEREVIAVASPLVWWVEPSRVDQEAFRSLELVLLHVSSHVPPILQTSFVDIDTALSSAPVGVQT